MTVLDPSARVSISIGELLTFPRTPLRQRLITRAAQRAQDREAARAWTNDQIRWQLVQAEAHRLNAAADRTYAAMAANYTTRIRTTRREGQAA